MFGCVRECDIDCMAEMVSYGDRVYCVVCCDSVSKISALPHTWIWCVLASRFSVAIKMMHGPINIRFTVYILRIYYYIFGRNESIRFP